MKSKWPNFFIIGVKKGGTTSLYNYLKTIPSVYMSPEKTPGYFWSEKDRKISTENYLDLFKNVKNEKIIGEATLYFSRPESAKIIFEKVPNAKIVLILRDPIQRAFSDYLGQFRKGYVSKPFEEAFDEFSSSGGRKNETFQRVIHAGFYYDSVKIFRDVFGENQFKIFLFDDFIKNTKQTIKEILKFIDIKTEIPKNIDKVYNPYKTPLGDFGISIVKNKMINRLSKKIFPGDSSETVLRIILNKKSKKPTLSKKVRIKLENIYFEDIQKLKKILRVKLPWPIAQ